MAANLSALALACIPPAGMQELSWLRGNTKLGLQPLAAQQSTARNQAQRTRLPCHKTAKAPVTCWQRAVHTSRRKVRRTQAMSLDHVAGIYLTDGASTFICSVAARHCTWWAPSLPQQPQKINTNIVLQQLR
jgi:hypothetical protein